MTQRKDDTKIDTGRRFTTLAAGVILLMIVLMLLPPSLTGRGPSGRGASPTVGTARDGTRVTAEDRAQALRLLDTLETVWVQAGETPRPLLDLCWGSAIVQKFRRDPEALFLVLNESRRGPGPSPLTLGPENPDDRSTRDTGVFNSGVVWLDQLHPLPTTPLGQAALAGRGGPMLVSLGVVGPDRRSLVSPTALSTAQQHDVREALSDFLTIQSAAALVPSALKVSTPVLDRLVAERVQRMTLRAAPIDATAQLAAVPEPTDAQLAEHFARYAGREGGVATKDNPFGFGYRVADRVKLEWVAIDRAAVRAAVEAERSPYDWKVDAIVAFKKNPALFASLAPASQPTTGPATQPTFESIEAGAIRLHVDRAADARLSEIERRLRAALVNDYQSWNAARTTHATTAPSSVGVPVEAADYLDRVAATIGAQFKVAPKVERLTDAFRDREELASTSPAFAALHRTDFDERSLRAPEAMAAPAYAVRSASTRPADDRAAGGDAPLGLYQPSQTVTDVDGARRVIFRVVATDPSHPAADLAAVRDRASYDWRIAQAQAKALERARAAADAVRGGSSPDAALAWRDVTLENSADAVARQLELTTLAAAQFREAVNDALLGGAATDRPVAALDVPLARRAYVAQRERLDATWQDANDLASLREEGRAVLANRMAAPQSTENPFGLADYAIDTAYLDAARIFERAGWTPVQAASH